ncbi:acid phosphatase [Synechococcus sp. PROS-7-1]|uniref:acid phosphatase n=1 Tax=Synechococcus sp. PROS-7-1 TaxID=1442556 RepID=UPI00185FA276|nr:phosphatase PAP2 family protein [Synechococcus sp. PROS-7-1]QNI84818.1 acid phosphatase [Synechococcus sp. PROS-7-1]
MTLLLALLAGVPAPARAATPCELGAGSPATLPEIKPGLLKGYLEQEAMADALALLEGPPPAGSAAAALDQAQANASFALRDSARWTLAARDADLHFPAAAISFSCALGVPINATDTPRLLLLMRRSMTDLGLSTYPAKNRYQRQRPFMVNNQPICTPADEQGLRGDGSYPSGHTAVGWGWGLILSTIAPERSDELIARGRAFGESRSICNVHWTSDVQAGELMGSATTARLQADPVFQADLQAARQEVEALRARKAQPNGDCSLEEAALAIRP